MQIKPGYRTSEFWFTLVSFVFSGLFLLGVLNDNDQKEELIRDVSHGVESIILIGGQILILWNYINSRKVVKSKIVPVPPTIAPQPETPETPETKTKIAKPRSTKKKKTKTVKPKPKKI